MEGAGGVCYFTLLPDQSQLAAPGTHQLTEAFTLDLVFWDCKQRPKACRLLRERVEQRHITAGNSERMIIDAFRVPRGGSTRGNQYSRRLRNQ